jgi:serine protease Do
MQSIKKYGHTLWTNLRSGHLATTFAVLAALSVGVLAGSMITGSVHAGQKGVDSSDARPLIIPNPVNLSNGFSAIVKQVGPAVVNINTESLPKQSVTRKGRKAVPNGGDGDQGDMQDFFNRFFGGRTPMVTATACLRAAAPRTRLRLHRRPARLHHHQQPRRG